MKANFIEKDGLFITELHEKNQAEIQHTIYIGISRGKIEKLGGTIPSENDVKTAMSFYRNCRAKRDSIPEYYPYLRYARNATMISVEIIYGKVVAFCVHDYVGKKAA